MHSTRTSPPPATSPVMTAPPVPRWMAGLAVAGPAAFAALVVLVDVLQYDWLVSVGHSPWRASPVSVNTWGPYGWLQVLAFLVAGASVLALAAAMHRTTRGPGRRLLSLVPLGLMGVSFLTSTAPCDCGDGLSGADPLSGVVHATSFYVLMLSLLVAPFAAWRRLRRVPGWQRQATWSLVTGLAAVPLLPAAAVLSSGDAVHAPVFYLFLVVVPLQWLTVLARRVVDATRNPGGAGPLAGAR